MKVLWWLWVNIDSRRGMTEVVVWEEAFGF